MVLIGSIFDIVPIYYAYDEYLLFLFQSIQMGHRAAVIFGRHKGNPFTAI